MTRAQLPYGSWPTPITSELVIKAAAALGGVAVDGDVLCWSELRPEERGRTVLVRDGVDVLPAPWNARTAVHEYGGGAWTVHDGVAYFVEWSDQRVYRLVPGEDPVALTPAPDTPRSVRFADLVVDAPRARLLCVRERHGDGDEARNEIVAVALDGSSVETLAAGADFYSDPRVSSDGRVCWLEWDHPDMPWDGTRLVVDGEIVAGGDDESISQPTWAPDASLLFISDRTGWSNLYRLSLDTGIEPVAVLDAEIGVPQWVFGQSRYALLDDGRIVLAYMRGGFDHLAIAGDGELRDLDTPFTAISSVRAAGTRAVLIGASPTTEPAVIRMRVDEASEPDVEVVRPPRNLGLDDGWFSTPEPIEFPTTGGQTAHALFYAPASPTHEGLPGTRPPLLVLIHGGPTSAARPMLQLSTQYWTSRGFAVVDVNYRGSTGYGRPYRDALRGQWGLADVDDCVAAATYLAEADRVDPARLCIRGGSAGGFTTLAALAFREVFSAGASHYGVADLEALARDTHKFESRYLDRLVAPYPDGHAIHAERSPIHHVAGFDRPLVVFQGLDDEVVPPNQSEMIVDALRSKGVPVAYVAFEGEQHGFRQAENIRRALDGELSFYAQVFGFALPASEGIEPIEVENL